ncbi:MAG: PQQ-binding-like beta-propeller repeat protein [Fimbriiglobus sp.]
MTFLCLLAVLTSAPDSWTGFRGDGSSASQSQKLPVTWSPSDGIAWKASLSGYGQSSPVVWGEQVYTSAIDGTEKETVLIQAVNRATGKVAWTKSFPGSQKGKNNPMMSRASPTPVVDAGGVYAFFETGDVIALNHSGELRWQRSISKDYGEFKNNHGIGSSPSQTKSSMIILLDHTGPSYLLALDKAKGETTWKTERTSRNSWTSPVTATIQNRETILVSSSGTLDAYDAVSGKLLATQDGLTGNNIPSPTVVGDLILVGAGENRMKPDLAASAKSNCCLKLDFSSAEPKLSMAWQGKKAISHHASPVVCDGYAYFVTKTGFVHCVDMKTGQECYAERLDNACWATPISANGHIYFFGKDGLTTVVKAGSTFDKVATNRLWSTEDFAKRQAEARASTPLPAGGPKDRGPGGGPPLPKEELEATRYSAVGDVVYGVAAVDRAIYLRTGTELICIQAK